MNILQRVLGLAHRPGADPRASDEVREQQRVLASSLLQGLPPLVLWCFVFAGFGEPEVAAVYGCLAVLTLASVVAVAVAPRSYWWISEGHLALFLLGSFLMTALLGGVLNSCGILLLGLLPTLIARAAPGYRHAHVWFVAFVAEVVLLVLLQPWLRPANNVPPEVQRVIFAANLLVLAGFAFNITRHFIDQRDRALDELRREQERSEGLLLNILPREVAAALKEGGRLIAEHFEAASILFADLVNFTPLSADLPPGELVGLLNEIFSHFDALVEKHGLEKIKTIGDCYMVAAGVPRPRPDHARAIVRLALDMQAYVRDTPAGGRPLAFRVGINSGPVVAGVIGRKKFIYDLWGDTVNTASRMESHGSAGTVQISRATFLLVKDEFVCVPRGTVAVKGKGPMEVWHVEAEAPGAEGPETVAADARGG
jgi:guanylate cyclase